MNYSETIFSKTFILFLFTIQIIYAQELITPIPQKSDYNKPKALLGKKLFFDPRLSADNTISCATCHDVYNGGDDKLEVSFGVNGKKGSRNSPTVLNVKYNTIQFWDGRSKDLFEQIEGPIHNPVEMASNFPQIINKINKDPLYKKEFSALYKQGITKTTIIDAIVEFQNALITPNSKFDQYLNGDNNALNKNELNGYLLFKEYGCISCHNGINIGGNILQKIGIFEEYTTTDLGVYHITKKEEDKFYFKVPSLRNVELTAPYFHNGKVTTLAQAVELMILYQVGFMINQQEKDDIIQFLKTLTGQTPEILKEKP